MSSVGLSAKEYFLSQLEEEEKIYREITRLDDKDMLQYKTLLTRLDDLHKGIKKSNTTKETGKALEDLVSFLFDKSSIFSVYENIRNTTNEIDQLLELNYKGEKLRHFIKLPGDIFLSECKNYNKKIDVTWVGKFYTLLESNKSRIGILFSYHGLTGANWNDATGLTRKLFLLKEKLEERSYIIDINYKDFEKIKEGESLLEIIEAKMKGLRFQTNFEKFLEKKHPALLENNNNE
ncbi:acetylglutamate semialdehyde dehydrogenase [Paenibacillus tritici]|uniref:acetylglutamate semialdehyde dehydrogenase n=1 Tax=Paenibacillus tritici TaxID=1873425 RepID=UPI001BA50813|nr:acetylglutamate semialdehyde dehydrogenase [Paenibacillus tritici]QUL57589.1 acetylglutamate semialdehyde dehydrogenase [Paenibacillus tritici]